MKKSKRKWRKWPPAEMSAVASEGAVVAGAVVAGAGAVAVAATVAVLVVAGVGVAAAAKVHRPGLVVGEVVGHP